MFFTIFLVKKPDIEAAKEFDESYQSALL